MLGRAGSSVFPTKGQVRRRNNLDKVHEVEGLFVGMLFGVVKRIDVVVRPTTRTRAFVLILDILHNDIAQLRAKAKLVDLVRKSMRIFVLEVIFQIMHVQVTVGERLSGCNVEVSNNLVDADAAFETASFLALCVEAFSVVLPLALLYTFSTTK